MKSTIPASPEVRSALKALTYEQLARLATLADVGFGTLVKIRSGTTKNPGIDTVRKFLPHLRAAKA